MRKSTAFRVIARVHSERPRVQRWPAGMPELVFVDAGPLYAAFSQALEDRRTLCMSEKVKELAVEAARGCDNLQIRSIQ